MVVRNIVIAGMTGGVTHVGMVTQGYGGVIHKPAIITVFVGEARRSGSVGETRRAGTVGISSRTGGVSQKDKAQKPV